MIITNAHIGDFGTAIIIEVRDQGGNVVDISLSTERSIILQRPHKGSIVSKDATFVTDGKDGKMQCLIAEGDLDTVGKWLIQGEVSFGSSSTWSTDYKEFLVDYTLPLT